jgi:PhnB protein
LISAASLADRFGERRGLAVRNTKTKTPTSNNELKGFAMLQLDTYLFFDGNCADAMRFYERTLGGKLDLMTHGDSPMAAQMPSGSANRILHARLELDGGRLLMASDAMVGQPYDRMKGFSLSLIYPTVAEANRMFAALAEGGQITMPIAKTFWAEAFGMLVDRFGTPWMVNGGMASK